MSRKVAVVFGTRPEAIKMCPLILQLKKSEGIACTICLTGQHREMLVQVMDVFGIEADYDLDIMQHGQSLSTITRNVLSGIDEFLCRESPDIVLVHGDTTTTYAAALAAFYRNIPVGHVEAGLRTYDMQAPYPEEFNRQSVDLLSSIYFAPTELARQNLLREGKRREQIFVTGNTVIDAMKYTVIEKFSDDNLKWASDSRLIVLTTHRRENIGEPMKQIFSAIKMIISEFSDVKVIFPIHKNPIIRQIAKEQLEGKERIRIIEPLDVVAFHNYLSRSYLILSDSGGIQEEAPALGKPVLVLRDTTERPEGIRSGTLRMVGTQKEKIYKNVKELLTNYNIYKSMSRASNPYGDGHASERICEVIKNREILS